MPLIIGFAAKTCYDPDGGGTSWYSYLGGNYTAAQAQDVAYAHVPEIDASNPKPACYPVRSIYWHDVIPAADGNTITQDIQWEGVVYVEVNGHKDTSCKAPPPATGPNQGTPQRPTLPEAPWRSYLRRLATGFRDAIRDVRANARRFRSGATDWVKLGTEPEPYARSMDGRVSFDYAPPLPAPPQPAPPGPIPILEPGDNPLGQKDVNIIFTTEQKLAALGQVHDEPLMAKKNLSRGPSAGQKITTGSLGPVTELNGVITLSRTATAVVLTRRPFTLRVTISTSGARNRVTVTARYRIGP